METQVQRTDRYWYIKVLTLLGLSALMFYTGHAFAAGSDDGLAKMAQSMQDSFESIAKLITAGAYIAGLGFAGGAIFKFKAHRDNPTQIPVGTPLAMMFIAAALLFMPALFNAAGKTVFGSDVKSDNVKGTVDISNPGGGS